MTALLDVDGLVVMRAGRVVLHGVDLHLEAGGWLALLGPNGSGKSTLLDAICGRLPASAGTIRLDGSPVSTTHGGDRVALGQAVAADRLPDVLTGAQCLAVHSAARGVDARDARLEALAEALRIARWLEAPVATYSYGTRQKLGVLLALVGSPRLVVLDESFNGLDPASARVLKQELQERTHGDGCAVILATHALDIVERHAGHAMLLHEGRIAGSWDRVTLDALHAEPDGFEAALAAAIG
ncbi:ATP-binding cassette domain-containing protein [Dokdonella sp. MW10]|uniref:ATP-binding cassette domain-containing protein n=1 Tax=Dokdonella sp. MW10 TaxID=2992926 RepID=UPI003F7F5898